MVAVLNLWNTLRLFGGGPGSGCNPAVGDCGRPAGPGQPQKEKKWRKYDVRKVGGYFRHGTMIARMYQTLEAKAGGWHKISDFEKEFEGSKFADVMDRLKEMRYTGKRAGLWKMDIEETHGIVRLILNNNQKPAQASQPGKVKQPVEERKISTDAPEVEKNLQSGTIVQRRELNGGRNENYLVTLDNGQKAVWKPGTDAERGMREEIKAGKAVEREVAAYQLAKIVGMTDMVPASVARTIGGERGVMIQFVPGQLAHMLNEKEQYDGKEGLAKAAAFDYIIANEDRHGANWLVENGEKLHLIDHGLSFPEKEENFSFNARILDKAAASLDGSPKDIAATYVAHKQEIAGTLADVGIRDEAIGHVMRRIDRLAMAEKWNDLRYHYPFEHSFDGLWDRRAKQRAKGLR